MALLSDLLNRVPQATYFRQIMAAHRTNGVPVDSWTSPRNTGLSLTQYAALAFSSLRGSMVDAISSLLLDYSTGTGLTLFAASQFQLARIPAGFTGGVVTLRLQAGAPGQTFAAGDVTVGTAGPAGPNTRLFKNARAATLAPRRLVFGFADAGYITPKTTGVTVAVSPSGASVGSTTVAASAGPGVGSITVSPKTDADGLPLSTLAEIQTAIEGNPTAASLAAVTLDGAGSAVIGSLPATSLDVGTLLLPFTATEPGDLWNLPTGSPVELKTGYTGVSAALVAWVGGTWITVPGRPAEDDDALKRRCVCRWATLGVAATEEAYEFWARCVPNGYKTSPVTQVMVLSNWNNGMAPGYVTVVAAGTAGALSNSDVAAVADNYESPVASLAAPVASVGLAVPGLAELTKKYPIGTFLKVRTVSNLTVNLTGTVYVYRRSGVTLGEAQAAVTAALTAYQATIRTGQILYVKQKIEGVVSQALPDAIARASLTGASVVTPTALQYPALNAAALSYVMVDA